MSRRNGQEYRLVQRKGEYSTRTIVEADSLAELRAQIEAMEGHDGASR